MKNEKEILESLYNKLEQISDIDKFDIAFFPTIDDASQEVGFACRVEFNSLHALKANYICDVFGGLKEGTIQYLEKRIAKTSNNILKAKYYHFIYILTKNNKFSCKAIELYYLLLSNLHSSLTCEENIHSFIIVLKTILELTEVTKYKTNDLKNQIVDYLSDELLSSKAKFRVLQTIKDSKIFKLTDLKKFPGLCLEITKREDDSNLIENTLNLGLYFALKSPENQGQICKLYELLGDNEYKKIRPYDGKDENIIIPHYNQSAYERMMTYYQKAKNSTKYEKAGILYNQNKRNLKLLKITSRVELKDSDKFVESLNLLFDSIVSSSTEMIVFDLCLGDKLLFMPNKKLEELANIQAKSIIYQYCEPKLIDININSRGMDVNEHCKFQCYGISMQTSISFVIEIILKSISLKKISFSKVVKVLNNMTFFGHKLIVESNNVEISYTWTSQIDFALRSFFEQCNSFIKGKTTDWRTSIDILSLRFEGILRDIVGLSSGCIVKIDRDGNTSDMLLDDLLRSETFSKIFNEDDRNLFFYTFTNKGQNIRNNVAHSFYKPQNYTLDKAVLVLLCVLRLAKYFPQKDFDFIKKTSAAKTTQSTSAKGGSALATR